jgi:hypothetical protein
LDSLSHGRGEHAFQGVGLDERSIDHGCFEAREVVGSTTTRTSATQTPRGIN